MEPAYSPWMEKSASALAASAGSMKRPLGSSAWMGRRERRRVEKSRDGFMGG